jgi:hypothetical protein
VTTSDQPFGTETAPESQESASDPTQPAPGSMDGKPSQGAPSAEDRSVTTADDADAGPTASNLPPTLVHIYQVTHKVHDRTNPGAWNQYTSDWLDELEATHFIASHAFDS